jgi:hypothetical protein
MSEQFGHHKKATEKELGEALSPLSDWDREWLIEHCGKVSRGGLEFMVFVLWLAFILKGCSF